MHNIPTSPVDGKFSVPAVGIGTWQCVNTARTANNTLTGDLKMLPFPVLELPMDLFILLLLNGTLLWRSNHADSCTRVLWFRTSSTSGSDWRGVSQVKTYSSSSPWTNTPIAQVDHRLLAPVQRASQTASFCGPVTTVVINSCSCSALL